MKIDCLYVTLLIGEAHHLGDKVVLTGGRLAGLVSGNPDYRSQGTRGKESIARMGGGQANVIQGLSGPMIQGHLRESVAQMGGRQADITGGHQLLSQLPGAE